MKLPTMSVRIAFGLASIAALAGSAAVIAIAPGYGNDQADQSSPASNDPTTPVRDAEPRYGFQPRTDPTARQDTEELRKRLQMLDAAQSVNPLADYDPLALKGAIDPSGNGSSRRAPKSQTAPARPAPKVVRNIGTLPPPKYSNMYDRGRMVGTMPNGTRAVGSSNDPESMAIPTLSSIPSNSVIYAGSTAPMVTYGTPIISNFQGGTFSNPAIPNNFSQPNPGIPYNPNIPGANPNTPPLYPRQPPMVNGAPFVSNPPCQSDARYMVSPQVYRQSVDCQSMAPPYAGTGSPFAYAPYAAMPMGRSLYGPLRPLIGLGQDMTNVVVGRGFYGQPKAYNPEQPFRNFFRYLTP